MTSAKDVPTELGLQLDALAYAHETLDYPDDPKRSWSATLGIGAGVLLGSLAVAALTLGLGWKPPSQVAASDPPAAPVIESAAPQSSPWSPPAATPTHKDDPDTVYLRVFAEESKLHIDDPVPLIALGHRLCGDLAEPGATMDTVAAALQSQYRKLTPAMAHGIVDAAVKAYCPQYGSP